MWPYRPSRLTEILPAPAIARLLGSGPASMLRSPVTLLEVDANGSLRRIDPPRDLAQTYAGPFCTYFRHGREGGKLAFPGADEACERCEERFARRVLESRSVDATSARCHMGLIDYAAPIVVAGQVVGAIVAGQRVESAEARVRITKIAGKLGKLTRAEVRTLEEANAPVEPAIAPADESARERLLGEIADIPIAAPDIDEGMRRLARTFAELANVGLEAARRRWEDDLAARLGLDSGPLPGSTDAAEHWLGVLADGLHRELGVEFVAVFLPSATAPDEHLRLAAHSGLSRPGERSTDGAVPAVTLDPARLGEEDAGGTGELERATRRASRMISAVHLAASAPTAWKDRLTKCAFAPRVRLLPGLEAVFAFGGGAPGSTPQPTDLDFLLRLSHQAAERFFLASADSAHRRASRKLARFERIEDEKRRTLEIRRARPIQPQRFDLRRLLDGTLAAAEPARLERGTGIDSRGLPERIVLDGDRPKLASVFACILRGAIARARPCAADAQPSIVVSVRREKGPVRGIAVHFDVVGEYLSGDEKRRIFHDAPAPEAATDAPATPGTGEHAPGPRAVAAVSLRRAQEIVALHGGRLHIESTRSERIEGAGGRWLGRTVISVSLPGRPRRPRQHPAAGPSPSEKPPDAERAQSDRAQPSVVGRRDGGASRHRRSMAAAKAEPAGTMHEDASSRPEAEPPPLPPHETSAGAPPVSAP